MTQFIALAIAALGFAGACLALTLAGREWWGARAEMSETPCERDERCDYPRSRMNQC